MKPCIFFFLIFCCQVLDAKPLNVAVRAKHAILCNPENGAILFEKGAYDPHYPASILKMAIALFILDGKKVDLDQKIMAKPEALQIIPANIKQSDFLLYPPYMLEHDAVLMRLQKGKEYSIRDLLHGLLLVSACDAANVLAEGISGSIDLFMDELNSYLKNKGILHTRFQNPSGLHHPAQITTAYDMAQIAALCFTNEVFSQVICAPEFKLSNNQTIHNTNKMLKQGRYHYPSCIGGKSGYIASAGFNLVAASEEKGRRLIAVVMGCEASQDCLKDVIALFEAAFCQKKQWRTLFSKDHLGFKRALPQGNAHLEGQLIEDVTIGYYPAEEMELKAQLIWQKKRLPIREGDEIGMLVVSNLRGDAIASSRLHAKKDVLKSSGRKWPFLLLVLGAGFGLVQFFVKRSKLNRR